MSARIFPRLILLPALLWVLLASTLVHVLFAADPPRPFTLLRTVGPSVFLDYYPTNTSGVSILHFSDQLPQLRASNADLFEVAADSAPITFDITSFVGGNRGFFAVTEFPGRTAADYATDEPEATEPTPAYLVQTLTAISYPLTANQPVTVSFQLLDATTSDPATVNGTVAFRLVDAAGDPVAFAYTLVPASLAVVNGAVNGTITVQTTAALSNVFLAIGSVSASGGLGAWAASKANALAASGGGVVGYPVQALSAYQQPTGSWRHPFHGANYALSGNYGEWREKAGNTAGRAHEGLDFAAPLNADVYPIAGGVVARVAEVGGGLGKLVVINHGNGYASRYLHITPSVQENQIVTTNTVLGKIAPIAKRHLHLEMRQNCAVYYRKNQPGKPAGDAYEVGASPGPGTHYNPLRDNDLFDAPLVVDGVNDSTAPRIRALNLFAATEDPRAGYIPASATGVRSPLNAAFLVAEVVDGDGTYTLAPWRVKLVTEEPASGALTNVVVDQTFASAAAISYLFQPLGPAQFGYPRSFWGKMAKQDSFPLWFPLDTSGYAAYPNGPRQVQLIVSDRFRDNTAGGLWKFGPKITDPGSQAVDAAAPAGSIFEVKIRNMMGSFPASMTVTPVDKLTLTVETPAQSSYDVLLEDPSGVFSPTATVKVSFAGHDAASEQTWRVRVKKKVNAAIPTAPETLTIKAASGVFPAIAHKMDVQIWPGEFALIPAGAFAMGNSTNAEEGGSDELPVHTVNVSAFYMGRYEVTKAKWDEVRAWGLAHGYTDLPVGGGKAASHPVQSISWYDMVKWCNARSEQDGLTPVYCTNDAQTVLYRTGSVDVTNAQVKWSANGYRLPTEAEWEKAARGGLAAQRFPWGATINHSLANYYAYPPDEYQSYYPYDTNALEGYHPGHAAGGFPCTSPVGSFAANGYGLYDMAGNVWEWCWDFNGLSYYSTSPGTDPQGPSPGSDRILRGGGWGHDVAGYGRTAFRDNSPPDDADFDTGFRCVRR